MVDLRIDLGENQDKILKPNDWKHRNRTIHKGADLRIILALHSSNILSHADLKPCPGLYEDPKFSITVKILFHSLPESYSYHSARN